LGFSPALKIDAEKTKKEGSRGSLRKTVEERSTTRKAPHRPIFGARRKKKEEKGTVSRGGL